MSYNKRDLAKMGLKYNKPVTTVSHGMGVDLSNAKKGDKIDGLNFRIVVDVNPEGYLFGWIGTRNKAVA